MPCRTPVGNVNRASEGSGADVEDVEGVVVDGAVMEAAMVHRNRMAMRP